MLTTLNLFTTSVEVDGHTVVSARKTIKGWFWYTNVGREGRKFDFPDKEAALRAGAKSLHLQIAEVIQDIEPC
jgi:hypothetical protein